MVFTLGTLFEATLLVINAIAILNEERFLKKGEQTALYLIVSILMCLLLFPQVGWGRDNRNEGFGDQAGMKSQLIALITAVQTLLRSMRYNDNQL